MSSPISLLFGVHAHQPVGSFPEVLADAHARCYHPFLQLLHRYPDFCFAMHISRWLLDHLIIHRVDTAGLASASNCQVGPTSFWMAEALPGRILLKASAPVALRAQPYHSVSQSEGGFEKIMQGVAIILEWPEREGVGGQHGDLPRTQPWQCRRARSFSGTGIGAPQREVVYLAVLP
jgi:hypothetical protein